jgi:CBS domain-containing protein
MPPSTTSSNTSLTLTQILENFTVKDVVENQIKSLAGKDMVYAIQGEPVRVVALRMAQRQVSSLIVFTDSTKEKWIGVVDFSDVSSLLLAKVVDTSIFNDPVKFFEELGESRIEEAVDHSGRDPLHVVPQDMSLKTVAKTIADLSLRRVFVSSSNGKSIVAVLSPSALCSFVISRLKGIMDDTLAKTIQDTNVGKAPVISVKKSDPFIVALRTMRDHRISCVAVIDDTTKSLAGSISMSDIKFLFKTRDFTILLKSSWEYIVLSRSLMDSETFPFFGVRPESRILDVLSKLLATHVHHVYAVDKNSKPIKVIGFGDVLKLMVVGQV